LAKKGHLKQHDKTVKKSELTAAPKTFTDGDSMPSVSNIAYEYRPVLGEVPEMHLPSVLPTLKNVAELNWSAKDSVNSIAPSFPTAELPAIETSSTSTTTSTFQPPPPPSSTKTISLPTPNSDGDAPPPPPPPGPPPPPAPKMQTKVVVEVDDDEDDATDVPPPPTEGGTARSSLLDEIRKGHMGRLKSAKKRKVKESVKVKEDAKANSAAAGKTSSGDIFSDLFLALNRRRTAIAEKNERAQKSQDSEDISVPDSDWN